MRSLLYRNQSIDLQSKSIDWLLYEMNLRHEKVNEICYESFLSNLCCLGGRTDEINLLVWSIVYHK